jgi:uncharacterized membrane protein YgaE (UPF0421/DUF939 family)
MKQLENLLVAVDNYISANSLTLTFFAVSLGILIFLIILFYLLKVNKNIKNQNQSLISYFEKILRSQNIDRSIECINEFNSTDFRIKVLSVLEIKLKMLENNSGDDQNIVNDAEFNYALINISHFFNNTGNLYLNDFLEKSIISSNLSGLSVAWFEKLEPYIDSFTDNIKYWKEVNEVFRNSKVLNLDEEVNPILDKALF